MRKDIADIIKDSRFFKRFGYKTHWISGSSTVVYPISIWTERKEAEIQLEWDLRGAHMAVKPLLKEISNCGYKVERWHIRKSDGSCPHTLNIYYE